MRFVSDILLSAPSILIGLFVYQVLVSPFGGFSGWAGALALAILVIPIVVRTTEDMLRLIPVSLREAAIALGAPTLEDDRVRLLPRGAGRHADRRVAGGGAGCRRDRAAAVHVAGQPRTGPASVAPMSSLPVTIYQYAGSAFDDWVQLAWAGALLITLGVLAINIVARLFVRPR